MVLPVPKKRAFKNLFRAGRARIYKPGGNDKSKQTRRQETRQKRIEKKLPIRKAGRGSMFLLTVQLTIVRALREIKHYQSAAAAEMLFFSRPRFAMLCREIQQDVVLREEAGVGGMHREDFRWEQDALIALQMCTEHVLTLFFEMTYLFHPLSS